MKVTRIVQRFPEDSLPDVEAALRAELRTIEPRLHRKIVGKRIAVAVGSRGIAELATLVRVIVSWLKEKGALPFVIPAMGSHGGGTAEGQRELLRGYGVEERTTGAPVVSSLDVVELDSQGLGNRVFFDAAAAGADGTVIVNRVKPHTDFHGPVESGLLKMCVLGLGKHRAALEMHGFGVEGLRTRIGPSALRVLERGNILLGVGVVENARDKPRLVRALLPADISREEPGLLALARASMARLPVEELDVLVVDELGKDVSGTGMDTNVIGRMRIPGEPEPTSPRIRRIVLLGVTSATHGNALGMGLADFVTRRLYESIDFAATYENVLTSSFLERGMVPLVAPTPREAVEWALRSCGRATEGRELRLARIRSTLRLEELWVSDALKLQLSGDARIEVTADSAELCRPDGELHPAWRRE
jgi:hypothetical protein